MTVASYLAQARSVLSDDAGAVDAKAYKKFLKSVGVSEGYSHRLTKFFKFKVQVEKLPKEKLGTRILNEPEKERQFRALEGAVGVKGII